MINITSLYRQNPRELSRAKYKDIQRQARLKRCSYRVGLSYIGRQGVQPCDRTGKIIYPRAYSLEAAQYARRIGLHDAARKILNQVKP